MLTLPIREVAEYEDREKECLLSDPQPVVRRKLIIKIECDTENKYCA